MVEIEHVIVVLKATQYKVLREYIQSYAAEVSQFNTTCKSLIQIKFIQNEKKKQITDREESCRTVHEWVVNTGACMINIEKFNDVAQIKTE